MSLFGIIFWIIFGAVVGWLAKAIHPGKEEINGWGTVALGVVGSFVGGFINWVIGWGDSMFSSSGLLMSVVGAVLCCYAYVNKDRIREWADKQLSKIKKK